MNVWELQRRVFCEHLMFAFYHHLLDHLCCNSFYSLNWMVIILFICNILKTILLNFCIVVKAQQGRILHNDLRPVLLRVWLLFGIDSL